MEVFWHLWFNKQEIATGKCKIPSADEALALMQQQLKLRNDTGASGLLMSSYVIVKTSKRITITSRRAQGWVMKIDLWR